jgi:hypothetical protein
VFAKEKQARDLGVRKAGLEAAMRDLFAADKIRAENYGPASKAMTRLVLK